MRKIQAQVTLKRIRIK